MEPPSLSHRLLRFPAFSSFIYEYQLRLFVRTLDARVCDACRSSAIATVRLFLLSLRQSTTLRHFIFYRRERCADRIRFCYGYTSIIRSPQAARPPC